MLFGFSSSPAFTGRVSLSHQLYFAILDAEGESQLIDPRVPFFKRDRYLPLAEKDLIFADIGEPFQTAVHPYLVLEFHLVSPEISRVMIPDKITAGQVDRKSTRFLLVEQGHSGYTWKHMNI
jgi:hypothetical protein